MDKKSDYALQSLVELYSILCNTIEDANKSINKGKIPIKSALYDYINNYLIYAIPFVLLKDEIQDKEQLAHDCYILTKSIIDNSELTPSTKSALLKPLKESGIYIFTSKVFKVNHLNGYIDFLRSTLCITDSEETEKTIILKDFLRPIVLFLVTGFPINKHPNDDMKENIHNLSKYIEFQIKILFDIFMNLKLQEEKATKEKPEQYTIRIIENLFKFMKLNKYPENTFKYASDLLIKIYSILFEENEKDSKTNCIFKAIKNHNTTEFKIDNTPSIKHKVIKSKTGARKNVTGTKRKPKKTSTSISRK